MILCPRFHLFEINDQPWCVLANQSTSYQHRTYLQSRWPQFLRTKVQDCLTLAWTFRVPFVQTQTPASLVARTLTRVLGPQHVTDYVYVDFASGAGGPTPYFEQHLNRQLQNTTGKGNNGEKATFVLTDLRPHVEAWEVAAKKSENLRFVPEGVDAADAPSDLLERVQGGVEKVGEKKKVMRLFSLAFHHFDDELAERILRNTVVENGHAFG